MDVRNQMSEVRADGLATASVFVRASSLVGTSIGGHVFISPATQVACSDFCPLTSDLPHFEGVLYPTVDQPGTSKN